MYGSAAAGAEGVLPSVHPASGERSVTAASALFQVSRFVSQPFCERYSNDASRNL
jgi:hypothetical protein